ncbi:hypothetical protein CYMTET_33989 [Cymbomonas tetramitiformis]|uniref:Uncharacterized protein n=1 Tax=Cymbomonas tetramitiformis TaxID=36881 RepID=A0AAE0FCI7_9CHLO|nr:hypothetical protein CYMTET_33989 [Cymbomonas tetramitiformis]
MDTKTLWDPGQNCTRRSNRNDWWLKFTMAEQTTVTSVGIFMSGDRLHDVRLYDVFKCVETVDTSSYIEDECTESLQFCNATLGQTTEQTCEGWGPREVSQYWALRITAVGPMEDPGPEPWLTEVYWYGFAGVECGYGDEGCKVGMWLRDGEMWLR